MTQKYTFSHLNFLKYLIPAAGLFFFIVQIVILFITKENQYNWYFYPLIILNTCSTIGCIVLLIFPDYVLIYGILGALYTVLFAFVDISELSICICYIVSQFAFFSSGFTAKSGKKFYLYSGVLLLFVIVTRVFIFRLDYLNRIFNIWPFMFALAIIFLLFVKNESLLEKYKKRTIIDLDQFDELSERQKDLVLSLLNDVKYEDFAQEHCISKSAIKKDAVNLFKFFDTYDKNSFVLKYSSCNFQRNGNIVYKGV